MSNLTHLAQLGGDAREVAEECVRRFEGFVITSSRRSTNEQAAAMATNCVKQRWWILGGGPQAVRGTYLPSDAAALLHAYSIGHLDSTKDELQTAFLSIMEGLTDVQLSKLSKHLGKVTDLVKAFDSRPMIGSDGHYTQTGDAAANYLRGEAIRRGGRFLEREGGLTIWHWQAKG